MSVSKLAPLVTAVAVACAKPAPVPTVDYAAIQQEKAWQALGSEIRSNETSIKSVVDAVVAAPDMDAIPFQGENGNDNLYVTARSVCGDFPGDTNGFVLDPSTDIRTSVTAAYDVGLLTNCHEEDPTRRVYPSSYNPVPSESGSNEAFNHYDKIYKELMEDSGYPVMAQ